MNAPLLLSAAVLLCTFTAVRAEDPVPPPESVWCQQHPQRCEAMRTRMKSKCEADPAKCAEVKQKLQEKAAACQADPQSCKDDRHARMEEICKKNPNRPVCQRPQSARPAMPATPATPATPAQ